MPETEPQITAVACILASRLSTEGVDREAAVEAWRGALRYARNTGTIDEITDQVLATDPTDRVLHVCVSEAKKGL